MTIPLSSDPLIMSPICRIPYDVLTEIFICCLPQYRLRVRQPNTRTAPMLLCQICSAWRTVALNLPILWTHLAYCLVVAQIDTRHRADPKLYDCRILKRQLAFLSWWRRNLGGMGLFLCLDMSQRVHGMHFTDLAPVADETRSLFTYIVSARYLEARGEFWLLFRNWTVGQQVVSSNPHTLVFSDMKFLSSWNAQPFLSINALSALRYLSLSNYRLDFRSFVTKNEWSHLIRVDLNNITTDFELWFAFMHAVHALEWGHFDITLLSPEHVRPANYTLPNLSTLSIAFRGIHQNRPSLAYPLSTLLSGLHLPALHTLALISHEGPWRRPHALTELHTILRATPAVTTLALGAFFLSLENPYGQYQRDVLPALDHAPPIWRDTPHLVRLQLQLPWNIRGINVEYTRTILENLSHCESTWLALGSPVCPIREITLVEESENTDILDVARVRKQIHAVGNVIITAESVPATSVAETWYEWSELDAFAEYVC